MNNVFKIYSGVPLTDNLLAQIDTNISRLVLDYELPDDDVNHTKLAKFLRHHPTIEFYVSSDRFHYPFYVLSDFPGNLEKYNQSFILVGEILHYINHDGHIDRINVLDFTQSNDELLEFVERALKSVNDLNQDDSTKKIIIPGFMQLLSEKLDDLISMRYRTDKPGDDIRLSLDDIPGYHRNETALSLEEIRQRNLTLTKSQKISSRLVWHEIFNHNFFKRSETPRQGLKDLNFLRFYPFLKNIVINVPNLESINGIEFLSDNLETFCLEPTTKKVSLLPLAKCISIKKLYLDGHKNNLEIIKQLVNLEKLTLRSITLDDLSILLPLANLWWLAIKLGGTKKLSLLPNIGKLKYLELWQIRGLNDISFVSKLCHLEYLFLDRLKQVTSLPDFSNCSELRTILLNMDSITDLSPLLTAKSLEELEFTCGSLRKFRDALENLHHPNIKQIRTAFRGPPDKYQF